MEYGYERKLRAQSKIQHVQICYDNRTISLTSKKFIHIKDNMFSVLIKYQVKQRSNAYKPEISKLNVTRIHSLWYFYFCNTCFICVFLYLQNSQCFGYIRYRKSIIQHIYEISAFQSFNNKKTLIASIDCFNPMDC